MQRFFTLLLLLVFCTIYPSCIAENTYLPAYMLSVDSYNSTMDPFTSGFSFRSGNWVYCPSSTGVEQSSIIRFQYDEPSIIETVRVFDNKKFLPTFPFDAGRGLLLTDIVSNRLVALGYDGKSYTELFQFEKTPGFEMLVGNYLYYSQGENVFELNYVTLEHRLLATYPGEQEIFGEYAACANGYIFVTVHGRGVYKIDVVTGDLFDLSFVFEDYPGKLLVGKNEILGYDHNLNYVITDYYGENIHNIEAGQYCIGEINSNYILANNDSLLWYLFKNEGESLRKMDLSTITPKELELPIGSVYLYEDKIFVEDYLKQIETSELCIVAYPVN